MDLYTTCQLYQIYLAQDIYFEFNFEHLKIRSDQAKNNNQNVFHVIGQWKI